MAFAAAHALHRLFKKLLHAVEAVRVVARGEVFGRPLGGDRGGAAEPADGVDRGDMQAGGLKHLDAAGHADVALTEFARLVEAQSRDKALPTRLRHRRHRLCDNFATVKAREPQHVLVRRLVRTAQLCHEQVQQKDDRRYDVDEDGTQKRRVLVQQVVTRAGKHAKGHLKQAEARDGNAVEIGALLLQGANSAREGQDEKHLPEEEQRHLGKYPSADEDEGRNAGGQHGEVG
mmetsp:Transcript_1965/g.5522  ORF Transcript_1965/g.5522 Transcript_1965/m.5522 type:complete len:232 (+) Transcript_1965:280-975(+)